MRSRSWRRWPARAALRDLKSLLSPLIAASTVASPLRAVRSSGKTMASAASRSASRRACRALFSSSWDRTTPRVARGRVSSSRTTIWPCSTALPSRTRICLTTPPVGCWTFLTTDFDDHRAACDHCPGELAGRGPAADAAHEGNHHRQPGDVQAADHGARPAFAGAARRIKVCFGSRIGGCSAGHEVASWFSCNARFPATAGRSGRTTALRSTASDGPNACCVPLASTRILLH